ncbi:hypothetical protein SAMN06265222_11530 [Neorhodopirellula lusitana]|uniref:Uncharacterized protein n=1 Tax=Neorhodopirellula lusitana TaxID=445327 RepID=A0ABY1QLD8_9BACT|nr:hypothetical protein SAMN06265222_11530 [Neorhodopirellula lusitana]
MPPEVDEASGKRWARLSRECKQMRLYFVLCLHFYPERVQCCRWAPAFFVTKNFSFSASVLHRSRNRCRAG